MYVYARAVVGRRKNKINFRFPPGYIYMYKYILRNIFLFHSFFLPTISRNVVEINLVFRDQNSCVGLKFCAVVGAA